VAEQLEPALPAPCDAERFARPCSEAARTAFRIGLSNVEGSSTLVLRCLKHGDEFRAVLRRFMHADTWSEEPVAGN